MKISSFLRVWLLFTLLGILCFSIGVLLAHIFPAHAAELNHEQAASIYALAHGQLGPAYPLPEKPPTIVLTSQDRMREIACKEKCQALQIHGLQVGEMVYVDENLDFADPKDASVLLHELVHYIQFARDGMAKNCQEWLYREREAYRIQATVLEKARVDARSIRMLAMLLRCREVE